MGGKGVLDVVKQHRGVVVAVAAFDVTNPAASQRDGALGVTGNVGVASEPVSACQQQHAGVG